MSKILEVKDLHVSFDSHAGEVKAVQGVSFHLKEGETLAIVGESGSGKSVTSQSILKLIPSPPSFIKQGEILFDGQDIAKLSFKQMEKIRGSQISMIFQDPMTSLNPTMIIGKQIAEGIMKHQGKRKSQALKDAVDLLRMVGIPNPEERIKQYPDQFSGGMRQRVMIAIAIACKPKILIADEPTTALDVTIQAQIIELLKGLQKQIGTSIILITHDLGVVVEMAHRVAVMYAGKIVESGTIDDIFYRPQHPYTWGLLRSVPRLDLDKQEELVPIQGSPPSLLETAKGCAFAERCPYVMDICKTESPITTRLDSNHTVDCWLQKSKSPVKQPFGVGGSMA